MYFDINVIIVDTILRIVLFDLEVEDIFIDWTLILFKPIKFDNVIVCYGVFIKNFKLQDFKLFKLVIGIVNLHSLKMCQMECGRKELTINYLKRCNDAKV